MVAVALGAVAGAIAIDGLTFGGLLIILIDCNELNELRGLSALDVLGKLAALSITSTFGAILDVGEIC